MFPLEVIYPCDAALFFRRNFAKVCVSCFLCMGESTFLSHESFEAYHALQSELGGICVGFGLFLSKGDVHQM